MLLPARPCSIRREHGPLWLAITAAKGAPGAPVLTGQSSEWGTWSRVGTVGRVVLELAPCRVVWVKDFLGLAGEGMESGAEGCLAVRLPFGALLG